MKIRRNYEIVVLGMIQLVRIVVLKIKAGGDARMKNIETESELFSHLKSMTAENSMSTIDIPGIGTFKIFLQGVDDALLTGNVGRIDGEKFELWDRILKGIQQEVTKSSFETWLKNTSAVKLDEQHICIVCHNSFQLEWIETHFTGEILAALYEVTNEDFKLEFCVEK